MDSALAHASTEVASETAHRAAAWYTELARYAVGQIDYATLLAKADYNFRIGHFGEKAC